MDLSSGIQLRARWQFCKQTQEPLAQAFLTVSSAIRPCPCGQADGLLRALGPEPRRLPGSPLPLRIEGRGRGAAGTWPREMICSSRPSSSPRHSAAKRFKTGVGSTP